MSNARFGPNRTVTVGTGSAKAADARDDRRYLLIQNNGPGNVFVNFGIAATAGNGVKIESGKAYEPVLVPKDEIHMIASESTAVVLVDV